MKPQFGIVLPISGNHSDTNHVAKLAEAAEEAGFDLLLVWDHYMLPSTNRTLEAWVTLAYLAGKTSRLRLGTCVTPIPFRPPGLLAKMVATLDVASGGRAILGVGAGWHRPEFEGYSRWDDARVRVAKTREGLELILRLWQEGRVDFQGRYYRAEGAVLEPKPVQKPHPPLWFGTTGPYMMRLAARMGDGWIPTMVSPQEFARGVEFIKERRRELGRKGAFTYAYDLYSPKRDAKSYIQEVEQLLEVGLGAYTVHWTYPPGEDLDRVTWFGREVIPSFR
jgi:probable F420-dependent oxidoreductase